MDLMNDKMVKRFSTAFFVAIILVCTAAGKGVQQVETSLGREDGQCAELPAAGNAEYLVGKNTGRKMGKHLPKRIEKTTRSYAVRGEDTLRLDCYAVPEADRARPCLLFVFGGGFVSGIRDNPDYLPFFEYFAHRGYVVISIDYRLGLRKLRDARSKEAVEPSQFVAMLGRAVEMAVEDLYTATGWTVHHAAELGIDTRRVILCGSSAGAVTVLQGEYGLSNRQAAATLPSDFRYAGVIAFAGAILSADSVGLVWHGRPAPIQMFHGDADSNVPYGKLATGGAALYGSERIAGSLDKIGAPYYFYDVSGGTHRWATLPMTECLNEIEIFLNRFVLKRDRIVIHTVQRPVGSDRPETPDFGIADYIRSNFGF